MALRFNLSKSIFSRQTGPARIKMTSPLKHLMHKENIYILTTGLSLLDAWKRSFSDWSTWHGFLISEWSNPSYFNITCTMISILTNHNFARAALSIILQLIVSSDSWCNRFHSLYLIGVSHCIHVMSVSRFFYPFVKFPLCQLPSLCPCVLSVIQT